MIYHLPDLYYRPDKFHGGSLQATGSYLPLTIYDWLNAITGDRSRLLALEEQAQKRALREM